jgi:hypothetical protein
MSSQVKDNFFNRGNFKVENGECTMFWKDTWLGDKPLAQQYPSLHNTVHRKQVLVADVLNQVPLKITLCRNLIGNKWTEWLHLVNRLMQVRLTTHQDVFV